MKTYAAYYDNEIRMQSSSGGLFSLIASRFDVVYGVEMDFANQHAVFSRKTTDISPLLGSKYIQAKIGDTFNFVKQDLLDGKQVLFTGTACQVNGLYALLQKDYLNLFTVDVICHGVPTVNFWKKFVEGKDVKHINFRSKDRGWNHYTYGMKLNDTYIPYNENRYMTLYTRDYPLRPSCYECVCKQAKKSDVTLGDFWGIETLYPSMTDNMGTSIVIARTDKGQKLFEVLKNDLVWQEVSYDDGIRNNPSEYSSVKRPENRDQFFKDMPVMSFDELYKKYCPEPPIWCTFARKVKRIIKKALGRT